MPDSITISALYPPSTWIGSPFPPPDPASLETTLTSELGSLATRFADRLAIVSDAGCISYADFLGQVGALAHAIETAGAPEGPVAVLLPPGIMYLAAAFACAAAGRPMLMVEAANPPLRNARIFEAAGATLVLHDGAQAALTASMGRVGLALPPRLPRQALGPGGLGIDDAAFIFSTSGTTGNPKLIVYSQRCLQTKLQCSSMLMDITPDDICMAAGSHTVFGVLHHALVCLWRGATLCLHDMREGGLAGMLAAIITHGVTQMRFTPSLFRNLVMLPGAAAALRQVRSLLFSGEPLLRTDIDLAGRFGAPGCTVQNLYGSTESLNFIWSNRGAAPPYQAIAPNGYIYPVAEYMLVDESGDAAGPGVEGEVVISARDHALGEWRAGTIDASRFPPDPRGQGRRLYYSGDLAQRMLDGSLLVLGRKDRLLKVNGQRVSLSEIEAALLTMPGCARAAVIPCEGQGAGQLAAFMVIDSGADLATAARAWLADQLPGYMIPRHFLRVAELPVHPGGKLNIPVLLALLAARELELPTLQSVGTAPDASVHNEGANTLIGELTSIWTEILGVRPPSPDVDFFALGGDSLKTMLVLAAVEERLGHKLADDALFKSPSISSLARGILGGRAEPESRPKIASDAGPGLGVFDPRGRTGLRLVRHALGVSRGLVLGMPNMAGHAAQSGVIASNALQDYDVWTFTVDAGKRRLLDTDVWPLCAREIADQLIARDSFRPRAIFGYSIAGAFSWLVDRYLQAAGWPPTTIINFDGGPLQDWGRFESHMPIGARVKPARMLLMHRKQPRRISVPRDSAKRWTSHRVGFTALPFRTLDHWDLALPIVVSAASDAIREFIETGHARAAWQPENTVFDTLGGKLLDLLNADSPPTADVLRRLVVAEKLPEDDTMRAGALFLLLSSGDVDLALGYASRITALHPRHRVATYVQVALLGTMGETEKALSVAEAWCGKQPNDQAMRDRARRAPCPPMPWVEIKNLALGSDASFDYAINLCHAHHEGLPPQTQLQPPA